MKRFVPIGLLCFIVSLSVNAETVQPNMPDGYAEFQWGTQLSAVLGKTSKAKEVKDGEGQDLERRVFATRKGKKRTKYKAARRLRDFRYWKQVGGLPARVELNFFDDVLYGAKVHLLYRRKDKRKLGVLYSALTAKYGEPVDGTKSSIPIQERSKMRFSLADGFLQVDKLSPSPGHRGMFRFIYQSESLGTQVMAYRQRLEGELIDQREAKRQRQKEKKRRRSEKVLKKMKDEL